MAMGESDDDKKQDDGGGERVEPDEDDFGSGSNLDLEYERRGLTPDPIRRKSQEDQ